MTDFFLSDGNWNVHQLVVSCGLEVHHVACKNNVKMSSVAMEVKITLMTSCWRLHMYNKKAWVINWVNEKMKAVTRQQGLSNEMLSIYIWYHFVCWPLLRSKRIFSPPLHRIWRFFFWVPWTLWKCNTSILWLYSLNILRVKVAPKLLI